MANYNIQNDVQNRISYERLKNKNYLLKSFEDFRTELLQYAVTYFPDKMNDFSETSIGGMLLDFAAIVGDSLSYYMDHQFNELDPSTATENENILKHIRRSGIKSSPPSPSTVIAEFSIRVNIDNLTGEPLKKQLPKFLKGLQITSNSGINFMLYEDVDFIDGVYTRKYLNKTGGYFILTKEGLCVSGNKSTESFTFGSTNQQFPIISLSNNNITQIDRVVDSEGNEYYEVDYLSQDTIYKSIKNENGENYYEILPAPYRFVREDNLLTGETILRFGSASKQDLQNNVLIDPTSAAISLYGREYFSKLSFDPAQLLKTNSLGISPKNTTVSVTYKYGGGISHNISAYSLENVILTSNILFDQNASNVDIEIVSRNISVQNSKPATGGTDGLTFAQLQENIPNVIKMQNRIVNYQDLLGRLYSMPAPLGRISKASIINDEYDIFNKNLYVLCYDNEKYLTYASDALKKNISTYINEYRLIGDSFRIMDAVILNFGIDIKVRIKEGEDPDIIKNNVIQRIITFSKFRLYQIGQPIILDDLYNIVINTPGVYSIASNKKDFIYSITGQKRPPLGDTRTNRLIYSNNSFNSIMLNTKDVLNPPTGSIFELKYPEYNINIYIVK